MTVETTLFVSLTDLAKRFGIDGTTLRTLALDGEIPSYRIGRKIMFLESDVKDWLQSQKIQPRSSKEEAAK